MTFQTLAKYARFDWLGDICIKLDDSHAMTPSGKTIYVNPNEVIVRAA